MGTELLRPNEVNEKIYAMLAATKALKPAGSQMTSPTSPTNPKIPRVITYKVLSKVSNAWDRLNTKPIGPDSIPIDFSTLTPSRDNRLTIKSIDIRQNEGINIGGEEKARKIAGIKVDRRPVASDRRSSRNKLYAESDVSFTPAIVENMSFNTADDSGRKLITISSGPFSAEPRFDLDLEDRILSIKPDGSSTPRALLDCRKSSLSGHRKTHSSEVGLFLNQQRLSPSHRAVGCQKIDTSPSTRVNRSEEQRLSISKTLPVSHYLKPATECKRVKKHPSPNKDYLERLKMALEQYTSLKTTGGGDRDLDELADMFSSPVRPLSARDKNQLTSGRSPSTSNRKTGSKGYINNDSSRFPQNSNGSSIPRSSGVSDQKFFATRSARTFRPRDEEADDTDELR